MVVKNQVIYRREISPELIDEVFDLYKLGVNDSDIEIVIEHRLAEIS
jgi:hypothetical protein